MIHPQSTNCPVPQYALPDEVMEVGSVASINDLDDQSRHKSHNYVIACYREAPVFPCQLVVGRAMISEIAQCLNDLSLPAEEFAQSIGSYSEPSSGLTDWLVGYRPINSYEANDSNNLITHYSQLEPVLESFMLRPSTN